MIHKRRKEKEFLGYQKEIRLSSRDFYRQGEKQ